MNTVDDFHRQRRMFVLCDGLQIAPEADTRSHVEWMTDEGWLESLEDPAFRNIVRGFHDPRGLFFYRDHNFKAIFPHQCPGWKKMLRQLKARLSLPDETRIWTGMSPAGLGDAWEGSVELKSLGEFLRVADGDENSESADPGQQVGRPLVGRFRPHNPDARRSTGPTKHER
jgi:hypothetical protein